MIQSTLVQKDQHGFLVNKLLQSIYKLGSVTIS